MKASVVRNLAKDVSSAELAEAASALMEGQVPTIAVGGDDPGEQLTHVMLAQRIRERVEGGEDLKAVFREVMAGVRAVLTDDL